MCTIVTNCDQQKDYEAVGELREIWPDLVWHFPDDPDGDENCLCNVNVEKTAQKHGWSHKHNGFGYDVWKITPPQQEAGSGGSK